MGLYPTFSRDIASGLDRSVNVTVVTTFTVEGIHSNGARTTMKFTRQRPRLCAGALAQEFLMKLQLISATVVAYALGTIALICYAELLLP
jgi:hypothetical protein